ncbi:hypothetical protein [Streptomyces sp. DSM 40750]|uniref:hypothetical protein n=1 Tax=Streptomyces sp. DSM 40750 TaxID=2801030 RepID=UPI00214C7D0B|nr:hypothetical protein [Streptomyces sp. DSM 40750]UUU23836.1 hypothetical protein JIX55_28275 [Streptomyces sp. DSM 40750]
MIRVNVSDHVVDDARDRQSKSKGPTPDQVESIAKRLRKGIAALPKQQYREQLRKRMLEFVAEQDMDLPAPETRSAFWSYQLADHPNVATHAGEELKNMHVAAAYTEAQNSIVPDTLRYLEGTPGGNALGEFHLWHPDVQEALKLDEEAGLGLASEAWDALSQKYAAKTENEALFFMAELNPNTVAYQTESRQLRQDGKLDIIDFAYPPPLDKYAGLAPETQELLASQAVRAQIHTFGYDENNPKYTPLTKAGHLDLEHLKSLPTPEAQRAAVLEVCARVAAMDGPARTADVEKYVEEIKVLRPDHEVALPSSTDLAWAYEARAQTTPVVSTHGAFLPGVEVNARTGPQQIQPPEASAQAIAGAHFLPGVTLKPAPAPAPQAPATPTPTQAPPTPEQARGPGLAE